MLKIQDINASYGEGTVLRKINLEAQKNKITCLVGRNGAGKTTTMKSIMGLVSTFGGKIMVGETDLTKMTTYNRARAGIGYVPQGRDIFPNLTVRENLLLGLEVAPGKKEIPEHIYEIFPILKEFLDRKGGDLSGGQQQQLAIARVLIGDPKILILDEPTEGIQPSIIQDIGRILSTLKKDITILMVEQYLEFALEIADYCYVIENGRITMAGAPDQLDQQQLQATMSL